MEVINFIAQENEDGGYTACALGFSIFTEAESIEELRKQIVDAVECHFGVVKKCILSFKDKEERG